MVVEDDQAGHLTVNAASSNTAVAVTNTYTTSVVISKQDISGEKELAGAKFEILDKNNKVVADWTSTTEAHEIKGILKSGETYTLVETIAPEGYAVSKNTTFTLDEYGQVDKSKTTTKCDGNMLIVNDTLTSITIGKTDKKDQSRLAGSRIQILDGAKIVDDWVSDLKPHVVKGLIAGRRYTLHEVTSPTGYNITEDTTFVLDKFGDIDPEKSSVIIRDGELFVEDAKLELRLSKVDATSGKEVEGAVIQIIDKETGKVVASWTSDGMSHDFGSKLQADHTYTMHEDGAPAGYAYTNDVDIIINKDGTATTDLKKDDEGNYLIEDEQLHLNVSKVDAATGKEVKGAKIQILGETGKVVDEWTSDGTSHDFGSKLEAGKTYTFHEDGAPAGYAYINDVKVTINKDGTATTNLKKDDQGNYLIKDEQLHINVSKVDAKNGKELSGAKIQVLDETGKVVDEWTSDGTSHDVGSKLEAGKTYTLHETVAPDGYDLAEQDTTFSINKDGTVNAGTTKSVNGVLLVEDQAKKNVLAFDKASMFGMSMVGAKMAVIRLDAGGETVKDTWTTNGKVHQVEGISDGSYVLRELAAPSGFTLAPDVAFTVRDGKAALKQAENGRLTTVGSVQVVVMTDATQLGVRDQRFAKVDEQGRFLPGAELQITTEEGNVIAVWTTDGAEHTERLIGGNYILTETKAPAGYQVADPIRFTVNEKGFITSIDGKSVSGSTDVVVTMTDKKIAAVTKPENEKKQEGKGVKTGDDTPILPMTMTLAISALAVLLILNKRKKETGEQ